MSVCRTCEPSQDCVDNAFNYSLQEDSFFWVLNCPPGFFCGGRDSLTLVCCDGAVQSVLFPASADEDTRQRLIDGLIGECLRKGCGPPPPLCLTPPCTPPPVTLYFNDPQSCTVLCPDGTPFTYTVETGLVLAFEREEANRVAKLRACELAHQELTCLALSDMAPCLCVGSFYNSPIIATGIQPSDHKLTWSASGIIPPGLTLQSGTIPGNSTFLRGTPVLPGLFTFTITATASNGASFSKTYVFYVVLITTTSLPDFTIGSPYSFQLHATGGGGNFTWDIISGTLPAGIVFDPTGLLHGTPTAGAGGAITFSVTDLTCETVEQRAVTPLVRMSTVSTTRIVRKIGYPGFTGDNVYHRMTWSGFATQTNSPASDLSTTCSVARIDYSGSSFLDNRGNWTQKHNKNLSRSCPSAPNPAISPIDVSGVTTGQGFNPGIPPTDLGYCYSPDPRCCNPCPETLTPVGNYAKNNTADSTEGMFYWDGFTHFTAIDETHGAANGVSIDLAHYFPGQVQNFPTEVINGLEANWVQLRTDAAYAMELSEQVTDAEAESVATVIVSTGKIAEFLHDFTRTRGTAPNSIYSRYTSVAFTLAASNLVPGRTYTARVQFKYSTGVTVTQTYTFIASGGTHNVVDNIPTPTQGVTIEVRSPSINYA